MRLLKFLLICLLCTLIGCSSDKKNAKESEDDLIETVADDESFDDENMEGSEVFEEGDGNYMDEGEEIELGDSGGSATPVSMGSEIMYYDVQPSDTLMLISYKLYGDYSRWRSLSQLNSVSNGNVISVGSRLKYYAPSTPFNWKRNGSPYLIKQGDTLGKISTKVYGKTTGWRSIWENNRPLIKDPNLIFAGFTLYYLNSPDRMAMN